MNMDKKCGSCAFKHPDVEMCRYYGAPVSADDYCPKWEGFPQHCSSCGCIIPKDEVTVDAETFNVYCGNCLSQLGRCPTCTHANECLFQTDPSPIPKMVRKQIRQGRNIVVTDIPNIDRIEITCKNGCSCFDAENGCAKQSIQFCSNWEEKLNGISY